MSEPQGLTMRVSEYTSSLLSNILDLLYPRNCVWSEQAVEASSPFRYLCVEASNRLQTIVEPFCTRCGTMFFGDATTAHGCGTCENEVFHFDKIQCAYRYRGPARSMIKALKYRDGLYMENDIRVAIREASSFLDFFNDSVCVPVPLTRKKLDTRGYNQAALIADCILAQNVKRVSMEHALIRTHDSDTQTLLSKRDRQRNVSRSFEVNSAVSIYAERRYIVVDDVFTTGATASACAKALKAAGATRVDVATFARG